MQLAKHVFFSEIDKTFGKNAGAEGRGIIGNALLRGFLSIVYAIIDGSR